MRVYNLDYINTIGYECEQGVEYFNCNLIKYKANRVIQMKLKDRDILYTRNSDRLCNNTIRLGSITKGNDDSCNKARDYIDLRMIGAYEHYSISDVHNQYVLLQTKMIDRYSNFKHMYGFRDISIVKYIGEI